MNLVADKLRADAQMMRSSAGQLLDSAASPASVRAQLSGLLGLSSVDELHARVTQIIESLPPQGEQVRLVSLITGTVTANVYEGLADVLEGCAGLLTNNSLSGQRQAQRDFNHRLNQAAARGDWDEFDRLTADFARSRFGQGAADGPPPKAVDGNESAAVDQPQPGT